jgi:dTDP-4-dehydrorhamnose 3,5-epimerase-like enzyme/dTDP-4-dehydrorhamnose reductase
MIEKFEDDRGILFFPIKNNRFDVKQSTISINKKNVLRGIHINNFDKYIICIKGKILDIIINFNEKDVNYLNIQYFILDPTTDKYDLFIPKNYGHMFLSLEDDSTLIYYFNDIFVDENTKHINYLDPYLNIKIPIENPIISIKDSKKNFIKPIDYIIFGGNGYIGSNIIYYLKKFNKNYIKCNLRLDNIYEIEKYINFYQPQYIINCAGLTGKPNIFWCNEHKIETIETNITFQLTLAKICNKNNIHLTVLGSGGIFDNDKFYTEYDNGNFNKNFYSESRIYLENIIKNYDNVLYLRINYPISKFTSEKNLLTKLLKYNTYESIDISISYLDNLIPILFIMIENNELGIVNFVNEGIINIVDIMNMYNNIKNYNKEIIINNNNDNSRSYAKLIIGKLKKYNPLNINDAIIDCINNYCI